MKLFGKNKQQGSRSYSSKLKDFLKNESIDDAEIIADVSGNSQKSKSGVTSKNSGYRLLALGLAAGLLAGFIYGRFIAAPDGEHFTSFDVASVTKNLQTTKLERVKYLSQILYNDVDVYDQPSNVTGNVIAKLNKTMRVEYLALVPSLDTKENVGFTRFDIKISRLFSKSFIIPEGTEVNILGYNGSTGEYDANVNVDGKIHNITLSTNEVKMPYIRGWVKVRTESGQEGYVYNEAVDVRAVK